MANETAGIASQMANAPIERSNRPQGKGNPIAKLLGSPEFRLVTNAKWYPDKQDKTKESMRFAFCDFILGGSNLVISASVYYERHIETRADGRYATTTMRLSMPKGLTVRKDDAESIVHLEAVKNAALDAFDEWRKGIDTATGTKGVGNSRNTRVVEAATKLD